jgi:hypothetical protein
MVNKQDCIEAIRLVKADAATATVWDMTGDKPKLV